MKLNMVRAALVLALAAAPAFAADLVAGSVAAGSTADPNRKICKLEKPIGSNISTRTCKTAAEWQYEHDRSQKFMQDMQQRTGARHGS
jgi:hypothetical protein